MPTACGYCGEPFQASPARTKYCRQACYLSAVRERNAETVVARFWAKVARGSDGECWPWTGTRSKGYGIFHLSRTQSKQQTQFAHRFAWEITNGPVPDKLSVLHHCDNPPCVNPNHLFVGTLGDNLQDARSKGRLIDGKHLIKVDDAGLLDIKTNYRRGNGKQLAAKYGVSLISILRIVAGTQRKPKRLQAPPLAAVLERVPSVQLEIRGEVRG